MAARGRLALVSSERGDGNVTKSQNYRGTGAEGEHLLTDRCRGGLLNKAYWRDGDLCLKPGDPLRL